MKQFVFPYIVLMLLVGCGKKAEAAAPPKETANPWGTPTRLALFMTQTVSAEEKAIALNDIASACAGPQKLDQWLR